jgi:hypothetical protein
MGKISTAWFRFIAIYMYILIVASGSLLEMIFHGVNDEGNNTKVRSKISFLWKGTLEQNQRIRGNQKQARIHPF